MSKLCIEGVKKPTDRWKKMKEVWDACTSAGVSIPQQVSDFFKGEIPNPAGNIVNLLESDCVNGYMKECAVGHVVDLEKLDPNIKEILIYNSWKGNVI